MTEHEACAVLGQRQSRHRLHLGLAQVEDGDGEVAVDVGHSPPSVRSPPGPVTLMARIGSLGRETCKRHVKSVSSVMSKLFIEFLVKWMS